MLLLKGNMKNKIGFVGKHPKLPTSRSSCPPKSFVRMGCDIKSPSLVVTPFLPFLPLNLSVSRCLINSMERLFHCRSFELCTVHPKLTKNIKLKHYTIGQCYNKLRSAIIPDLSKAVSGRCDKHTIALTPKATINVQWTVDSSPNILVT